MRERCTSDRAESFSFAILYGKSARVVLGDGRRIMEASGTRIAHLSDVHMLEARPGRSRAGWSMRHHFLSFGRPLDVAGRRRKLGNSLSAARRAGASHVVISGDLTETGLPGEYEALAEALHDCEFSPDRITLVPGNHDLYESPDAWRKAVDGPLAAFAETSACGHHQVIERAGAYILPLDVAFHQAVTRSAGLIGEDTLAVLAARASDPALADRPLVVVQHHPPFVRKTSGLHWLDGLVGAARLMTLLEGFRHVFVLHGHLHTAVNRVLGGGAARILGATAVVEDRDEPRIRLYDVRGGGLQAVVPPAAVSFTSQPSWA
jgi:3',5'-cyclic AMP phosphodiesterase CpdA